LFFFEGEIRYTLQTGSEYMLDSRFTLGGNRSTTFEEVKNIIFQCLEFEESQYSIDIQCRVNIALFGNFYFNLIRVYNESSSKIASQMSVPKMRVVQLYVRMNLI
jgi:hypothetical protein